MSAYRQAVRNLSDETLIELFAEGEAWERDGSLPNIARLRLERQAALPIAAGNVLNLQFFLGEVWREIAVRSMQP